MAPVQDTKQVQAPDVDPSQRISPGSDLLASSGTVDSQPTVEEWTWSGMIRRHWIEIYLVSSLLVHIGCLVALQLFGSLAGGVLRTAVSSIICANVLTMCAAIFLESHLYRRDRIAADGFFDDDYDIRPTEKQARNELEFIAAFSTRRWRFVFRGIGHVGETVLKYCSGLLVLCSLVNIAVIVVPRQSMPNNVAQYAQLCLGILSVVDILAAFLVVLNRVYFRYDAAKARVSSLLSAR